MEGGGGPRARQRTEQAVAGGGEQGPGIRRVRGLRGQWLVNHSFLGPSGTVHRRHSTSFSAEEPDVDETLFLFPRRSCPLSSPARPTHTPGPPLATSRRGSRVKPGWPSRGLQEGEEQADLPPSRCLPPCQPHQRSLPARVTPGCRPGGLDRRSCGGGAAGQELCGAAGTTTSCHPGALALLWPPRQLLGELGYYPTASPKPLFPSCGRPGESASPSLPTHSGPESPTRSSVPSPTWILHVPVP